MYAPPSAPAPTPAPAPPDPYSTAVMSYADKVKSLLDQRAQPVTAPTGPPTTGMLPGKSPENPSEDNMTINARSGEYVFPEPAVKYYGVKKLEDMVHKAIEDINPPGQPAPEPPTQAQTFARGGLINRKHFLRLPKGHAYDKVKSKMAKMPDMPVGLPPLPVDNLSMAPPPPQLPQQPQGYWGGGIVHNNPDWWEFKDMFAGPTVQIMHDPNQQLDNPNSRWHEPFPPFGQINDVLNRSAGTEINPQGGGYPTPRKQHRYMGGVVEPEGYAKGGMTGWYDQGVAAPYGGSTPWGGTGGWDQGVATPQPLLHAGIGNDPIMAGPTPLPFAFKSNDPIGLDFDSNFGGNMHGARWGARNFPRGGAHFAMGGQVQINRGGRGGGFDPSSVSDMPYSLPDVFGSRAGNWYGTMLQHNPYLNTTWPTGQTGFNPYGGPGVSQGPTRIPSYFNAQGYPYAQPVGPDTNVQGYGRTHAEHKTK